MNLLKENNFESSLNQFSKIFDEFFNSSISDVVGADMILSNPAVNIKETDEFYQLELAAPGLAKEDFKLKIEKNHLKISAELKSENEESENKFVRREFSYQKFHRSFRLAENIDTESINASYNEGILSIALNKIEQKDSIQIAIS